MHAGKKKGPQWSILSCWQIWMAHWAFGFRTGLESGLICYQCVSTHPGCGVDNFAHYRTNRMQCQAPGDRCVKLIERRGLEIVVTRDCLSNLIGHRVDIPGDKYDGCKPASHDVKLGQHTFNRIKELDTKRNYYDNTTWCLCHFDHWCNSALLSKASDPVLVALLALSVILMSK